MTNHLGRIHAQLLYLLFFLNFLLLYVPPEKQPDVKQKLSHLLHVPFSFTPNGSQIIFYDKHVEYKDEEDNRTNNPIQKFIELEKLN